MNNHYNYWRGFDPGGIFQWMDCSKNYCYSAWGCRQVCRCPLCPSNSTLAKTSALILPLGTGLQLLLLRLLNRDQALSLWSGSTDSKTLDFQRTNPSVQFSSVAQSCPALSDPMNRSTPGLPVHHQLPEFTQTHVHWIHDAIQPAHPLSSPSPPAPNPSQHQSLKPLEYKTWHHPPPVAPCVGCLI